MEYKKAKWEREFDELKGLDIKAEIEALQPQKDAAGFIVKRVDSEGEAKLKKLELFEKNKGQIDNLIAYRDRKREKLEKLLEAQKQQQNDAKSREAVKIESLKIEEEHKKIVEKLVELDSKIKSCKDEDEKAKLEAERKTVEADRVKNDDKYIENQNKMKAILDSKPDNKDYSKEIAQLRTTISKTNLICRNLFEGKSWNDISVALSGWDKKFTDKNGKLGERVKAEKAEKAKTEKEKTGRKAPKTIPSRAVVGETGLTEKKKFDWRHPIKSFQEWRQRRKTEKAGRSGRAAIEPETRDKNIVKKEVEFYQKVAIGPVAFRQNDKENSKDENEGPEL